jgi:hypothetical protein
MGLDVRSAPIYVIGAMAICACVFLHYFKGLNSEVIISDRIAEFVDSVDSAVFLPEEKLILIDIDDTLFQSAQLIGTPNWYYHLLNMVVQAGVSKQEAQKIVGRIDKVIQENIHVELIEEATLAAINRWQEQGAFVVGITSRSGFFADVTEKQLAQIGLNFSHSRFACLEENWDKNQGDLQNGVLYVGDRLTKGAVVGHFISLLEFCGFEIRLLAAVDDQARYINQSAEVAKKNGLNYLGNIYGRASSRGFDLRQAIEEVLELEAQLHARVIPDRFRHLFPL